MAIVHRLNSAFLHNDDFLLEVKTWRAAYLTGIKRRNVTIDFVERGGGTVKRRTPFDTAVGCIFSQS